MIDNFIEEATEALIRQQHGKLLNKGLHTEQVASNFLPRKVLDCIKSHRRASALSSLVPGVGMVGVFASVWHMYYSINEILGISFSKTLVKSISTGIASNLVGFYSASFILDKIPFANILNAPIMYGATCVQGFVYIKTLSALNSTSGTDIDKVISDVVRDNTSLIRQLISEFCGIGANRTSRQSVSMIELDNRRNIQAGEIRARALSQLKYIGLSVILCLIGIWYCSTHESYTRGVTDIWITSWTSTTWNVWWYLWGGVILFSVFTFFRKLVIICFGYADYFKIKSTPLSSFAKENEYLSDNKPLDCILHDEYASSRWNKIVIIISHFVIGLIGVFLSYLFYIYCVGHDSSELITVKYIFMDASVERDTNFVWYIMAIGGILSCLFGLYNLYMFFKNCLTLKMKG